MTRVMAFQPRRYDPPQFVADGDEELIDRVGEFIGAGQCDGCGCATYRIERRYTKHSTTLAGYSAVCAVDPTDDFLHPDPCGTGYPIFWKDEQEVCF